MEAARLLERAAARGNSAARVVLGGKYLAGSGVAADPVVAHMWFRLAAALGNEDGVAAAAAVEGQLSEDQIEEARRLAKTWRPF